jgi:hypothetical protein
MTRMPDEFPAANPYTSESDRPAPDSPRRRLPVPHRQVWAALQDGLRTMPRVREAVVWSDRGWRWSWAYACGEIGLAFLIPTEKGVLGALVLQEQILDKVLGHKDVSEHMAKVISTTEPKEGTRTCWVMVVDVDSARDFLLSVRAATEVLRAARACHEEPQDE